MSYAYAIEQPADGVPVELPRAISTRSTPPASAPRIEDFNRLEWSVIVLARGDRLSTLDEPGRFAKALRKFLGVEMNMKLASKRLEALRRMSVLAWHRGSSLPSSEIAGFQAAGFTLDQYAILQAGIARERAVST